MELYAAKFNVQLPPGWLEQGFMTARLLPPIREGKRKPAQALLRKTFEAAERLKTTDPEMRAGFLLAAYSLRAAEMMKCERSWICQETLEDDFDFMLDGEKVWVIRTNRNVKGKRQRQIPIPAEVAAELVNFWETHSPHWPEEERQYLLPRPVWDGKQWQGRAVDRWLRAWMRGLGWKSRKLLHELRALFLRRVRSRHGLDAAAALGGHRDSRTTERNYTGAKSLKDVVIPMPVMGGTEEPTTKTRRHEEESATGND